MGKNTLTMAELLNFDNLRSVLEDYGRAVAEEYRQNLIKSDRLASERLFNSITTSVRTERGDFIVEMTLEDYWKYIEEDTRPHWPPASKLLEWIRVKPVIPRPDSQGRIPSQKSLAFLIGRRIAGKAPDGHGGYKPGGTTGSHDLRDAKREINAAWRERIEEALGHDLENYIRKVLVVG